MTPEVSLGGGFHANVGGVSPVISITVMNVLTTSRSPSFLCPLPHTGDPVLTIGRVKGGEAITE
jgi:hypothetical protein